MVYQSAQFNEFVMERISGPEYYYYEGRVGTLEIDPPAIGPFEEDFQAPGSRRTVRFSYYYSPLLHQLFVVGAHLIRRGEPSDWDTERMEAFLAEIRAWELDPGHRPELFPEMP